LIEGVMMKAVAVILVMIIFSSCSSTKYHDEEHENLKKDYEVKNSSSKFRPGWIEDAEGWASENDMKMENHRYFSFETTPKVGRTIACNLAKAKVRVDIAGEISTTINQEITAWTEGDSGIDENNPSVEDLQEFVDTYLSEKIHGSIVGASIKKTYWEKRFYLKDLGAKSDYSGFTCAVFVKIPKKSLDRSMEVARAKIEERSWPDLTKEQVQEILKRAKDNLVNN